ncbi:MAG: hypothetical protein OS112_00690 [Methanoregula sp.]|nr:MAG: hypothetical protein OS112_00690 [Methanoregula sp.]
MKSLVPLIAGLIILGALVAGCTGTQNVATPSPTPVPTTSPTPTQTTSFTLGASYLSHPTPYSFTSEKDVYTEQFRATNEPWGIEFTVNPTNEDPQYTWFEMKVTQMDTGKTDTFGYGRTYDFEKHQLHPMYNAGPYKVEMKGNRVSVSVNIAKRNP